MLKIEQGKLADAERESANQIAEIFARQLIPSDELFANLHVFMRRQTLSRILFLYELYRQIVDQPGVIVQCGVRFCTMT